MLRILKNKKLKKKKTTKTDRKKCKKNILNYKMKLLIRREFDGTENRMWHTLMNRVKKKNIKQNNLKKTNKKFKNNWNKKTYLFVNINLIKKI